MFAHVYKIKDCQSSSTGSVVPSKRMRVFWPRRMKQYSLPPLPAASSQNLILPHWMVGGAVWRKWLDMYYQTPPPAPPRNLRVPSKRVVRGGSEEHLNNNLRSTPPYPHMFGRSKLLFGFRPVSFGSACRLWKHTTSHDQ